MASGSTSLNLNGNLSNLAFNNWRLDPDASVVSREIQLPETAQNISTIGAGFLQTRTIATHNHLHATPLGTYVFLREQQGCLALFRLLQTNASDTSSLQAQRVTAALPGQPAGRARSDVLEPHLPASAVAITGCSEPAELLLVSCGFGDLQLVSHMPNAEPEGSSVSAVAFPMRPPPPLRGVRPFLIEAAYEHAGQVRCIISVLRSKAGGAPAACEIYAITLQLPSPDAAPAVIDCQLLKTSAMRPHAVVVSPQQDCVLLALDPDDPSAPGQAAAAGMPAGTVLDADAAASAAEVAEGYDVNPHTMAEAVANLAHFTSNEPAEWHCFSEHLADLDRDTGPEGEGALGTEPDVAFVLFSLSPQPGVSSAATPMELQQMQCGPHRLLGVGSGSGGTSALLGLTDDVDCAIVRISIADRSISTEHLAMVPAMAYVAAGKTQRRATLFGLPGDTVATAIVEAYAYVYLYKEVAKRETVGSNAIISMGLDRQGVGVLGAQLSSAASGLSQLTVLTEDRIKTYSWRFMQ